MQGLVLAPLALAPSSSWLVGTGGDVSAILKSGSVGSLNYTGGLTLTNSLIIIETVLVGCELGGITLLA